MDTDRCILKRSHGLPVRVEGLRRRRTGTDHNSSVFIPVHQWLRLLLHDETLHYQASETMLPEHRIARKVTEMEEPLYKSESQAVVGSAMEVLNEIGHGFHEKPYENALMVEFRFRGIPCDQQRRYEIVYKTEKVGDYIPDLIAFGKIVIDTKVIEKITAHEVGQMMNYLKVTGLRLGYILNFKHPKLEWKRIVR